MKTGFDVDALVFVRPTDAQPDELAIIKMKSDRRDIDRRGIGVAEPSARYVTHHPCIR